MRRKLTAILCADVQGYSRLMGEDEEATHRTLTSHRKVIDGLIEQHHGRFVNSAGDSVLAEFASVVNAVQCAVAIQGALKMDNADLPRERRMDFRIGINLGDVMVDGEQIYGDGVNVAARLESLAEPGGICISSTVREHIKNKLTLSYDDLGEKTVKNIAEAVHVWRVLPDGTEGTRRLPRRYLQRGVFSLTGLAIAVGTFLLVQHLSLKPPHTSASIQPPEKQLAPPSRPSIAVLPFTNLSGDPEQEYFSDGIANQLIEELSRLPGLLVISRNSSFAYKGKPVNEQKIGRDLGVKYMLEGSVRRAVNQVRIGVDLVDSSSGTEMWTQRFDRPLQDIFAVQDEIVSKVVTTLGLVLKLNDMNFPREIYSRRTDNLEAFEDYLRGMEYFSPGSKSRNEEARRWFERAIAHDPKYADALAYLGTTYLFDAISQGRQKNQAAMAHAQEFAQKALDLDGGNSPALTLQIELDLQQGRIERAVADGQREIALNPNSYNGYAALSDALASDGQSEEAIRVAQQGMRLDPELHAWYAFFVARPYVDMGRYNEAIPLLKEHVAAFRDEFWAHYLLVVAYTESGHRAEAQAEAGEVRRIRSDFNCSHMDIPFKDEAARIRAESSCRKLGFK